MKPPCRRRFPSPRRRRHHQRNGTISHQVLSLFETCQMGHSGASIMTLLLITLLVICLVAPFQGVTALSQPEAANSVPNLAFTADFQKNYEAFIQQNNQVNAQQDTTLLLENYHNFVMKQVLSEENQIMFPSSSNWDNDVVGNTLMEVVPASANCTCDKTELCAAPPVDFADPVLYVKLAASLVLMMLSALFSGLTLGLLGLDLNSLSIVAKSDPNPRWRKYARQIIPVRRQGNLLLCTLLVCNVCVNAAFSILTSDLTSGLIGFLVSSALIVVFGEIIPQATCSRYALPIGANTLPLVMFFIFISFPITFPLSLCLDIMLGQELGTLYNNEGLKELLDMHAQSQGTELISDSAMILRGAIDFSSQTVGDIMTKLEKCFMLEISQKLDIDTLTSCWQSGHSRIPVYDGNKDNIVGVLFVKDLILLNPEEEVPLKTVLTFYGREALRVFEDTHLNSVLALFKTGRSHLAIVQQIVEPPEGDPYYKTVGLVTLEDVIEEIIKDEIVDETDQYRSNEEQDKLNRTHRANINMFSRRSKAHRLTPKQVIAVSSYLSQSTKYFQMLPENFLQQLLGKSMVISYNKSDQVYLYRRDEPSDFFTLVLTGKVEVLSGEDRFQTELGPWSFISMRALTQKQFVPDFDAKVVQDTQFLQIKRADFWQAVKGTVESEENFYLPPELNWITTAVESPVDSSSVKGSVGTPSSVSNLNSMLKRSKSGSGSNNDLSFPDDSPVSVSANSPLLKDEDDDDDFSSIRSTTPTPSGDKSQKVGSPLAAVHKSISLNDIDYSEDNGQSKKRAVRGRKQRSGSLIELVSGSSQERTPFVNPPPRSTSIDSQNHSKDKEDSR